MYMMSFRRHKEILHNNQQSIRVRRCTWLMRTIPQLTLYNLNQSFRAFSNVRLPKGRRVRLSSISLPVMGSRHRNTLSSYERTPARLNIYTSTPCATERNFTLTPFFRKYTTNVLPPKLPQAKYWTSCLSLNF